MINKRNQFQHFQIFLIHRYAYADSNNSECMWEEEVFPVYKSASLLMCRNFWEPKIIFHGWFNIQWTAKPKIGPIRSLILPLSTSSPLLLIQHDNRPVFECQMDRIHLSSNGKMVLIKGNVARANLVLNQRKHVFTKYRLLFVCVILFANKLKAKVPLLSKTNDNFNLKME